MGKWSALKEVYPKAPIDLDYQQKIELAMQKIADLNAEALGPDATNVIDCHPKFWSEQELATAIDQARFDKAKAEDEASRQSMLIEGFTRILVQLFEDEGKSSTKFLDGSTVSINPDVYPTVKDKAALKAWIVSEKMEDLLTLNFQTMQSIVKERLTEGKTLPPGIDVFLKDKLSRTGAKKQQGEQ